MGSIQSNWTKMPVARNVRITEVNGKKHINLRPTSPKFRALLSIDGGGVRGIIPAIVMDGFIKAAKEVLRETYPECADLNNDDMIVEVKDCFDTIAGNSAGSILALYFASSGGRQDLYDAGGRLEGYFPGSTEGIVALFDQLVNVIFKLPTMNKIPLLRKISGVFWSIYGYRGLEQGLSEVFGDVTLKQLQMNTYIPAYELNNSRPVAFYCRQSSNGKMATGYSSPKNPSHEIPTDFKDQKDESAPTRQPKQIEKTARSLSTAGGVFPEHFDNSNLNIPVKVVAQASASAPVYFSSTTIDQAKAGINLCDGPTVSWVDGGVVSNNPTMQALAFMASSFYDRDTSKMFPMSKMAVLSVGTGTAKSHSNITEGRDGLIWWVSSLFSILMDSHAEVNHAIVDALFDGAVIGLDDVSHDRYVRINRIAFQGDEDHKILGALDRVSQVPELKDIGEELVEEYWDTMKDFIKNILLAEEDPPSKEQ